jgi:hypothetical protein
MRDSARAFCLLRVRVSESPNRSFAGILARTEFLDAETGGQKSSQETANACRDRKAETIPADIPAETAYLEFSWKPVVREDWVVETIWTKLPTPHAEIEPVSETRARNGIFCCRDRAAKWAHSPELQEQRPR